MWSTRFQEGAAKFSSSRLPKTIRRSRCLQVASRPIHQSSKTKVWSIGFQEGARSLHPGVLNPEILHLGVLHPGVVHLEVLHPEVLHPKVFHPEVLHLTCTL